jgi:phosphoesterase RecJ-like protein
VTVPADVVAEIRRAKSILLASHIPMDGDGLGSALALRRGLLGLGARCEVVTEAPLPRVYSFLPGYEEVRLLGENDPLPDGDLVIGMDAGEASRLGRLGGSSRKARLLNLDHHVSNDRFGDVCWIDTDAAATGEMVFALLRALGAGIDAGMAQCLLVAIVTDTGRFCYSNTRARTHEIAAELLRLGAVPDEINARLYRSVSRGTLALQARAIARARFPAGGRLATLDVPFGFGADLGIPEEEVKELIDLLVSIEGVVVAALARGLERGGCKVSLRSNTDRADCARFSAERGGGGHVRAAGFSMPGSAEEALRDLLPALEALAR